MKRLLLMFAVMLISVPIASCNRPMNRHAAKHERAESREGRGGHGLKRICAADLAKYCTDQARGRERRTCLQDHMNQLSADCKAAVEARGERRRRRNF